MAQDPFQSLLVGIQHPFEKAFGSQKESPVLGFVLRLEQARTHHGSECEGNYCRDHHGNAECYCKLAEQASHVAGQENHRLKYSNQLKAKLDIRNTEWH